MVVEKYYCDGCGKEVSYKTYNHYKVIFNWEDKFFSHCHASGFCKECHSKLFSKYVHCEFKEYEE